MHKQNVQIPIIRVDKAGGYTIIRLYANVDDPIESAIGRKCNVCHELKLRSEFPPQKRNKDGMHSHCRPCLSKRILADQTKRRNSDQEYRQKQNKRNSAYCKKRYQTDQEYREQERKRTLKWKDENKEKAREKLRNWHQNNPEKRREYAHNYRAQKLANGGIFTDQDWIDVKAHFNDQCPLSGLSDQLTWDHFIPISYGGLNDKTNIISLHKPLNSSKGNRNPFQWINTQPAAYRPGFDRAVQYLADQNNMTVTEYTAYVNDLFDQAEANTNVS